MKQIHTPWEIRNLGVDSCEIIVSDAEIESKALDAILSAKKYPYMVAKLPVCRVDLIHGLEKNNWRYIETQFTLVNPLFSIHTLNLKKEVLSKIEKTTYSLMTCDEIDLLYKELDKGSFTTDRIYLDSAFDKTCASKRYINWIKDLVFKDSIPCKVVYEGNIIGFFIFKNRISKKCGKAHLILASLYKEYIGKGLGILMETSVLRFAKDNGAQGIITCCSSNNIPVIKIRLSIGYKLQTLSTVMVKHTESQIDISDTVNEE